MSDKAPEAWAAEIAGAIRGLPDRWDDRRGAEFDALTSDERGAIGKGRANVVSKLGRLPI